MRGFNVESMRFWWVNQNQTWEHERSGGYLWAPYVGKDGHDRFHWSNMEHVLGGDLIFSYASQKIRSVSIAQHHCYRSNRPAEFGTESPWKLQGRRLDVQYMDVMQPASLRDVEPLIQPMLAKKHSPVISTGERAVQGYLFEVNQQVALNLLRFFDLEYMLNSGSESDLDLIGVEDDTTRKRLVDARLGQGKYREDLIGIWGSCAITGAEDPKLLIASHVMPWRTANNSQRLDPNNGLLLSPSYDRAFDQGLITFDETGTIILDQGQENSLLRTGVTPHARLRHYSRELEEYMHFHRSNEFRKRV